MKRFLFAVFFIVLLIPIAASAFTFNGNVKGVNFLEYQDFHPLDDAYSFTLKNSSSTAREEFYLIIRGFDFQGKLIMRDRVFIDFLSGNGSIVFTFPGRYSDDIIRIEVEAEKPKILDIRQVR